MTNRLLLSFGFLFLLTSVTRAEHRVAMIVSVGTEGENSNFDPAPLTESLKRQGFRVTSLVDPGKDDLVRRLRSFAETAPTRGTALVWYAGPVGLAENDGGFDLYILGGSKRFRNDREISGSGIGATALADLFEERSGAANRLIVLDGPTVRPEENQAGRLPNGFGSDLPAGTLIVKANEPTDADTDLAEQIRRLWSRSDRDLLGDLRGTAARSWTSFPGNRKLDAPTIAISDPENLRLGTRAGEEWVNGSGTVFCWCPPGTFRMGSPVGTEPRDHDEDPVEVTFSRGFWIGKYELTRREASRHSRKAIGKRPDHPYESQHWDDARRVPETIAEREREAKRLPRGWDYAFPSEYEWEYAARAGTDTPWFFGTDVRELPRYANFADRSLLKTGDGYYAYADPSLDDGVPHLARVGSYLPNPWGLHDVYGNVYEMTETPYSLEIRGGTDPQFEKQEKGNAIARGGSWVSRPEHCRSAFRNHFGNRKTHNFLGCRLILRQVD